MIVLFVNWEAPHESFAAKEMLDESLQRDVRAVFCISPVRSTEPSKPKVYFP